MQTLQQAPVINGTSLSRAEFTTLASIIEAGNAPLPPYAALILKNAPESFDDLRPAEIAVTVRRMRDVGEPVDITVIGEKHLPHLTFISTELFSCALPVEESEYYAEKVWRAFQIRQAKRIGHELIESLESSPDAAKTLCETAVAALNGLKANAGESLAVRLALRVYDPKANLEKPIPLYRIGNVAVCTAGNLTTISAQAKAGKTASIAAMIASTFAHPDADCLAFNSRNPQGRAVIHIDTEQSPFDHAELVRLMSKRACMDLPAWFKSYCLTGWRADDIRRAIPLVMELAQKEFGGIHSLVLDGCADAANDVNDPAEANAFVAELHALAIEHDCAIVGVIHLNPGSEFKTRGHLGSQLERKAETNLKCDKEDETITLWAEKNRHAPIPKKTAPRFAWNTEAGMHTCVASLADSKEDLEFEQLSELFRNTFKDRPAMSYTDLTQAVVSTIKFTDKKRLSVDPRTAQRKIARADTLGIVKKTFAGLYELRT